MRFYGRLGGGGGDLSFRLDGRETNVSLSGTSIDEGPKRIWGDDSLGDGDHQLLVEVYFLQPNASVVLDYFEYVPLRHLVRGIVF